MRIDVEKKWFELYVESPKEKGSWFAAIQLFRKKWEFGITRDFEEGRYGSIMISRYYLYAQQFNHEGLKKNEYQFPRKNRWSHVTG